MEAHSLSKAYSPFIFWAFSSRHFSEREDGFVQEGPQGDTILGKKLHFLLKLLRLARPCF